MIRRLASATRFAAVIVCSGALVMACSSTSGSPVVSSGPTSTTTASSTNATVTDDDPTRSSEQPTTTADTTQATAASQTAATSVEPATFCTNPGQLELTYRSGTTPPPYHYEWTFTVEGTKGTLAFSAGYARDQTTWTEHFELPDGDAAKICTEIIDAVQSSDESMDDSVGGSSGNSTIVTPAGRWTQKFASGPSITLQDAMSSGHIPSEAWDAVQRKFKAYQDKYPN